MSVYYEDDRVTLHHGDALDVLRELADNSVAAVVTDPPYGLEFMGKDWDAPWKAADKGVHAEARTRRADEMADENKRRFIASAVNTYAAGKPFQDWCEQWATECLRVLKPGGHMLAFGGTRTWHRLACAVEDAGFEVRDSIAWLYGSGFPKSLDVSKAIDKQRHEDREPVDAVRAWLNARRLEAGMSHDAINKHFGHASNGGGSSSSWMTNPTSKALPTWGQWLSLKTLLGFSDDMDAEVWRLTGNPLTVAGRATQDALYLIADELPPVPPSMSGSTRTSMDRKPVPKVVQREVWDRDDWTCQHCGTHRNLTVDHIVPISKGGADEMANYQTLCGSCNSRKGAR